MIIDTLIQKIREKDNPTVVGLDTSFDYLPDEMRAGVSDAKGAAEAIFAFNKKIGRRRGGRRPCRKSADRVL